VDRGADRGSERSEAKASIAIHSRRSVLTIFISALRSGNFRESFACLSPILFSWGSIESVPVCFTDLLGISQGVDVTPATASISADVGSPPSPILPDLPVPAMAAPATVVIIPFVSMRLTVLMGPK
jgi:hypothetical protein